MKFSTLRATVRISSLVVACCFGLLAPDDLYAQCAYGAPAVAQTVAAPTIVGATVTSVSLNDNQVVRVTGITAGAVYRVYNCGSGFDTQITIFPSGGGASEGYNDDNGPECAGTAASINYAPAVTGTKDIKLQRYSCSTAGNVNGTVTIRLVSAPAATCTYTVPGAGNNSITTCSGTICDPGGTGNYVDNQNGYTVINPSIGGNMVRIVGTASSGEACCDYVRVYNGTGTGAPLLGQYNMGTAIPTLTSTVGPLTIQFVSDVSLTGAGFSATISCVAPTGPSNDACSNAIAIASLPYTSAVIANALATDDSPASSCDGPYKNVWWTVTGICGTMTAITCTGGTNFDDEISVFTSTGGCSGPWTQVACNDDNGAGCTNNYAGTSWTATAGTTYYITVGSYFSSGATGNLQLNVTATPFTSSVAPTGITGTTTICAGGSTTLTAVGGTLGTGASIQWFTGSCGGASAGTGASISVSPGTTTTYYVRYSGTCNTTACAVATVVVAPLPTMSCGSYGPACSDGPDIALVGSPAGGTWSGTGVTGSNFDPSAGTQTLTYNYTDPNYSVHSIAFAPRSTAGGGSLVLGDDQVSGAVPIGFNFTFFGTTYTNLYVSSNGFVTFNAASGSGCCSGQVVPDATDPNNLIAAAWDDLYPPGGGTITYLSSGSAPNRTMVVSYSNVDYCCSGFTPMVTTQIVLYETSNTIEIHTTSIMNITPGTMGIENAAGTVAVVVPGRNGSAWSATNEGYRFVIAGCSNSCQTTITVNPAATANAGGPYVTCGGTAVNISATANGSGSWSGGLGSFANASNASTTYTPDPTEVGGSVTLTWTTNDPDGAGPCTSLGSNATLNVNTPATANANGPYTTCGTTAVNISATTNGSGSWSGGLGSFANASNASTTYTPDPTEVGGLVTLTWTTDDPDGAGPCSSEGSNATLNVNICAWYSQSSGNLSDPIWSAFPVGTPGPATFTSTTAVFVQNGHTVTNTSANVVVDELTIDAGGTLTLNASTTLNTNGDVLVNGTLTADDNSTLLMSSAVAQTATFASTTSFWDLAVDATVGCTVIGNVQIRGSLDLLDGNFDCTGNQVSLTSSATQTGRLGPVSPTASYTGNLRIERYRPAGLTNWMFMGSPIQSRTVNNWQDDFITAGYPGSQFPNFDNPVGSNILWPSIRWYDETNTGAGSNDGLQGVSSNLQPLTIGQGFAVWAGSGLINTAAFLVDLQNNAPVIASTPITLPMSYTNTGNPTVDGWNLVSNPLPSPIDFESMSLGADVLESVTYFNPASGNTAAYDRFFNISTNGGTRYIQSMQGFLLKATGAGVTTTVSESDKANTNSGGMFGLGGESPELIRLSIGSGLNDFRDEAVVHFLAGNAGLDNTDVLKYTLAHDDAPQLSTLIGGSEVAIDAHGPLDGALSIPLRVNAGITGTYSISADVMGGLVLNCISLEDLETGSITSLASGNAYSFTLAAEADPAVARFVLHINNGPVAAFTADNSTVVVGQQVQFTATSTTGNYAWSFGDGNQSTEQNPQHAYAAAGTYTVTLNTDDGVCSSSASGEVTVELSTSVAAASKAEHRAWATPQGIVVEHAFTGKAAVTVELLDATGRMAYAGRMNANRQVLPSAQLANGAWFVRLDNGAERVTLRVPLAR